MPNPKLGTVTMDVKGAVSAPPRAARSSSAPRRPASSMPASARRASTRTSCWRTSARWPTPSQKAKPTGAKGTYVQKAVAQLDDGARACRSTWRAWPPADAAMESAGRRDGAGGQGGRTLLRTCPRPHVLVPVRTGLKGCRAARRRRGSQDPRAAMPRPMRCFRRFRLTGQANRAACGASARRLIG